MSGEYSTNEHPCTVAIRCPHKMKCYCCHRRHGCRSPNLPQTNDMSIHTYAYMGMHMHAGPHESIGEDVDEGLVGGCSELSQGHNLQAPTQHHTPQSSKTTPHPSQLQHSTTSSQAEPNPDPCRPAHGGVARSASTGRGPVV